MAGQAAAGLLAVAACAGCADPASLAGTWKVDCNDYWGVQIHPAGTGLYSVTFCGLSGCMKPGTWMADSPIVGDPRYEVVSADRIRIQRADQGHFTYVRCATNPAWEASVSR